MNKYSEIWDDPKCVERIRMLLSDFGPCDDKNISIESDLLKEFGITVEQALRALDFA